MVDLTVRYNRKIILPKAVNKEKTKNVERCCEYYKEKYKLGTIYVIRFIIGAKGTIPHIHNKLSHQLTRLEINMLHYNSFYHKTFLSVH